LVKAAVLGLVAGEAEGGGLGLEQVRLVGAVGQVAGVAALRLEDGMDHLLLEGLAVVAGEAVLRPLGLEEVGTVRAVGVVARGAARAPLQGGMHVLLVESDRLLGVAAQAELVAVLLEDQLPHQSVAKVAALAVLVLHPGMRALQGGDLLGEGVWQSRHSFFSKRRGAAREAEGGGRDGSRGHGQEQEEEDRLERRALIRCPATARSAPAGLGLPRSVFPSILRIKHQKPSTAQDLR
jgi:hypothetical protein